MKIIHISTSDNIGGAALAANRLNKAFNLLNEESRMLVLKQNITNETIIPITKNKFYIDLRVKITEWIKRHVFKPNYTISLGWTGYDLYKLPSIQEADIIYIHWTGFGYLSIKDIANILNLGKPTFIFMHDMWFITGGCHHSFECNLYKNDCSKCPRIGNNIFNSISALTFKLKKKYLTGYKNLQIVTPSNWLSNCVKESALFNSHNICVIPNPIDTDLFKPLEKNIARQILKLPLNKKIILFGANGGKSDKYKGWNYLVSAISKLENKDVIIVLFGGDICDDEKKQLKYPTYSLGYLHDEYSTILAYNSADVFVIPSLAENFPNTILESLSCGTPVAGFNVGGIPDLIIHKQNGYLAEYMNIKDLANGINWILENTNKLSKEIIHNYIKENFSFENIISLHKKNINKMI